MELSTRFAQSLLSLAIVVASYGLYSLVAVPWLEHSVAQSTTLRSDTSLPDERSPTDRFRHLIDRLFPEGSWERQDASVIKTDQLLILLREHQPLENGQIRVFPCTVVFRPEGFPPGTETAQESEWASGRTWTLHAAEGAVLKLEGTVDFRHEGGGRLVGAYISGPVLISGSESAPGENDSVEITTRNVQFNERRLWTPHEVHFRVGQSFATGRDLNITFSDEKEGPQRLPATVPARIKSLEIVHVDRVRWILPVRRPDVGSAHPQAASPPVEISCRGSLLVDLTAGVGRVSDQVRVSRTSPQGVTEQLDCAQLALYFTSRHPEASNQFATRIGLPTALFDRIVATGSPAVFTRTAPRTDVSPQRIEACRLEYELGRYGDFVATGPGRYQARLGAVAPRELNLCWGGQLRWQGRPDRSELLLTRQTSCSLQGTGEIAAETIRVWLTRQALGAEEDEPDDLRDDRLARLRPRQMAAQGHVRVAGPNFQCQVEQLEVQLEGDASGESIAPLSLKPPERTDSVSEPKRRVRPLDIQGQRLQVTVGGQEDSFHIQHATLTGNLRCVQAAADTQGELGFELRGDSVELHQMAEGRGQATLRGSPAVVRAQQLDLSGAVIHLDRGQNRMWIDGPGTAVLPLPADMAARYPKQVASVHVVWNGGLDFDGQTMRCQREVHVRGPAQLLRAATLSATLSERIDLSRADWEDEPLDVAELAVDGDVFLENRSFDEQGLSSIDTGFLRSLRIDQTTSRIHGDGPGWLESVRYGRSAMLRPGTVTGGGGAGDNRRLVFLRVEFQRGIEGSIRDRQLDFADRIRATYGPTTDWDERIDVDQPELLPNGAVLMRCQQLRVLQLRPGQDGPEALELIALGNAMVEGNQFAARAHRMSYDQGKDLLVVQGDNRSDAQLWRQMDSGGPRQEMAAREIRFWPQTNRVKVDDLQFLNLGTGP